MGIIQKRADELKRGNVLPVKDGSAVLVGIRHISADCVELMACIMADDKRDVKTRTQREFISSLVAVEVPDLTPAQQHADELVDLARRVSAAGVNAPPGTLAHDAAALLDKIKPPEPPTLAEMAAALSSLAQLVPASESGHPLMREAASLSDRARRAGVLK